MAAVTQSPAPVSLRFVGSPEVRGVWGGFPVSLAAVRSTFQVALIHTGLTDFRVSGFRVEGLRDSQRLQCLNYRIFLKLY